jgi:hypothetical protein
MSLTALLALFRATRRGGKFVRTPKHRIEKPGQEWRHQAYVRVGDPQALGEAFFGIGALAIIPVAGVLHQWLLVLYTTMFALGFLTLASLSAVDALEVIALRNLGRRALARFQAAKVTLFLLGACGVLLLVAARMPEPFEDGYAHWLIAANLASTGHLHDPLFGMEDTWLPAYHVLAAAVLRTFGLWQLGALKALGALLGLVTLSCVYALAPNMRQARLAVALLALNPVFLFTSGSAVVEPLLTALLTGAALAAVRGRMKVAALLAAVACLTATKAWIWVAAVAGFAAVELLRRRAPAGRRWPALAWAVPAIAVLVLLQLGFAPATHSVARGSLELTSATTRGSIPSGALARVAELALTYGRAALPLFAFGAIGLWIVVHRWSSGLDRATVRFLHFPALVYLTAVFGLVAIGAYTGSHRYLYPALPSLALLAAAALGRYAPAVRLVGVAATGLIAVAFLPVFTSFAADNAGLIAAGRAAANSQGVLVTDSPVVAFYSHKPPAQISGSQFLPLDRAGAINWLQAHGASELVMENISYYRAVIVFPDLAAGRPSQPFTLIGNGNQFQVSGGKTVYAYALKNWSFAVAPPGEGKTAPLAKGLTLKVAGSTVAGEGMGLGVPIVHYPDGWVYSRTATTVDVSTATGTAWKRTYQLDEIGGDAAHNYSFVPITSRGAIEVTYTVDSTGVAVNVRLIRLDPGYSEIGILNEQSAAFNDLAADGSPTLVDAQFGNWEPVTGTWARLQSRSLGVQWSLPSIEGAQLHGGREHNPPQFNWAGLDYLFPSSFAGAAYHINVQEAR